jgi:hypothetical protein
MTNEVGMKFVPLTVSVKAAPSAVTVFGEIVVTVGTGLKATGEIVKSKPFDVPPPGAGLVTVTIAEPAEAMAADGIVAVS